MGRILFGLLVGLIAGAAAVFFYADRNLGQPPAIAVEPQPIDPDPDMTVTLSPGLLTELVRQGIESGDAPLMLENVTVRPGAGALIVRGEAPVARRVVAVVIQVQPIVIQGSLKMRVIDARLGPLPAPGNIERLVEEPVNARIKAALAGLPTTITGARVDESGLAVMARVRVGELSGPRPTN